MDPGGAPSPCMAPHNCRMAVEAELQPGGRCDVRYFSKVTWPKNSRLVCKFFTA